MKLLTVAALPIALALSAIPAHAMQVNPARAMAASDLGSFSFSFTRPHPEGQPGNGGGGICTSSPENATVLLALLAGAGLFYGRRTARVKATRRLASISA